jgi:hypothetical protein
MRKNLSILFVVFFTLFLLNPRDTKAQVPPKARAFVTMCAYGAGGGAMLGMASMAFGMSSRAIAQGASLGLYAGIIFGTYVLVSHHQKRYGQYDDSSPYQDSSDVYGDEYQSDEGGSGEGEAPGGFFERFRVIQDKFNGEAFSLGQKRKGGPLPPLQINLLQYNF